MAKESEIIFYQSDDGIIKIEAIFQDDTFWMTQKKIAELFGVQRPAITKHLKNIFESGELVENSVSSILEHTADDGKKYKTTFYNLDTIIAVGYRSFSSDAICSTEVGCQATHPVYSVYLEYWLDENC
jgi:hypothetical protein